MYYIYNSKVRLLLIYKDIIRMAERAGFEPAVRYKRTLAFQASALSRSATSPF